MIWYYIDESITDADRRKGPYSIEEIMDFVKTGVIKKQTLVWHSGMEAWVQWQETEEFKHENAEAELIANDEQVKEALESIIAEHMNRRRYAGFIVRGAAYFIDNFILSAIGILLLVVMNAMQLVDMGAISEALSGYVADPTSQDALDKVLDAPGMHNFLVIWGVAQAVYFIVFTALKAATPGKMVFGLRVVAANGSEMSWILSVLRYVASLFSQLTLMFYGIGYLIVILDPKRRSLHDWVARTFVMQEPKFKVKVRAENEQEK